MALAIEAPSERKRVKVYELRENDWFDRGTGLCTGQIVEGVPRIFVESEDQPDRVLLVTRISKDDGYQKQQETLIVWTEANGTDLALSFQEAEGCAVIWDFVSNVQQHQISLSGQDELSDDALESFPSQVMLPQPDLGNLPQVEHEMRVASSTQAGRDALCRFVIRDEYIMKLLPLVEDAEDLESLPDLHRLCNIMKCLILLNDNTIIELVVSDFVIGGVVGALEYDPDFPTHKANHRQYLNDRSRYKEVVPIKDPLILRKIRHTFRLQYLKDVVLARILDDPTFSVLNSLIFFNQVDIVQHLQNNAAFLNELFALFSPKNTDLKKKEDAVQFLHQCAVIAKSLQAPARANLMGNFISHGLLGVISFAVKHPKPAIRTTGIDILVLLLDQDPILMRGYMLKAVNEKKVPLTDTLIELLHAETDLGVKNQLADAIRALLDPQIPAQDAMGRIGPEYLSKVRLQNPVPDAFIQNHFDESAKKLFLPLKQLESRSTINDLTFQEVSLYSHLVDILTFFVRQHLFRSRNFMHAESLAPRVAQLLTAPQKHLKLTALKFFRTLTSLQDTFYLVQMTHNNTFELILNIVYESMPRDNLLNSAVLELFEFIKRENIKPIINHVVEKYRGKMKEITYVDTFQNLILRYDQMQGHGAEVDATLFSQDEATTPPQRTLINGGQRWQGVREMDAAEEEYFDASDEEEDEVHFSPAESEVTTLTVGNQQNRRTAQTTAVVNGSASPVTKRLVDYPDDDDDAMDMNVQEPQGQSQQLSEEESKQPLIATVRSPESPTTQPQQQQTPPYRYTEKRRRDDDEDDDELVKLSSGAKRRSSISSNASSGSTISFVRKKTSFSRSPGSGSGSSTDKNHGHTQTSSSPTTPVSSTGGGAGSGKKIAINFSSSSLKVASGQKPDSAAVSAKEKGDGVDAPADAEGDETGNANGGQATENKSNTDDGGGGGESNL